MESVEITYTPQDVHWFEHNKRQLKRFFWGFLVGTAIFICFKYVMLMVG